MSVLAVTGHRFLVDLRGTAAGIEKALRLFLDVHPARPPRVVCLLAEGGDQMVAQMALEQWAARLIVPLPMPQAEYLDDFCSEEAITTFRQLLRQAEEVIVMPAASGRAEAYQAAGFYMLDHSDVLLAIWDGGPGRGPGGTSDIVMEARQRGMPMIWVHAASQHSQQHIPIGQITCERFENPKRSKKG